MNSRVALPVALLVLTGNLLTMRGAEYHVSVKGDDGNQGSKGAPWRTIQRAANLARPGDTITVHAGTYRERINPPRGGSSDRERIVYRAAPGEEVEIKGSEVIRDWVKVQEDVWKVIVPNSFFGDFNPYQDLIRGDWFDPRGREHHTGAVYLNGDWLTEATKLDEVLMPAGTSPAWLTQGGPQYLVNVAWFQPLRSGATPPRTPAAGFAAQQGVQAAPCEEGGECIGWIDAGDWVRYNGVDFGTRTEQLEIRAASVTDGGVIEVRLDSPAGELLGSCAVPNTGGWQAWASFKPRIRPVEGVKTVCLVFRSHDRGAKTSPLNPQLWFAQVDAANTTIWAQFKGVNPNEHLVEINARRTVFYPDQPGRDFITVRGFTLRHAATPWAPPTAEQIGLLGTHWSKGWVIEDNVISHSVCSGVALGKHGDEFDNTSANTAEGYVKTIERALARGWNRDTIGHHVVRNNTISHCEQAGVVGSMGAAFSTVTGNTIHDIHVRRLFSGAEMAGIKFHAAIDTTIQDNHIYRTCLGLWLDWMAQGTRVSRNCFHDNAGQDLFVEVDHGPFLVDNNLFLSPVSLLDMSEGGAYAHNLFTGKIISRPEPSRETPFHPPHATRMAGLMSIRGGDDRFYNNVFVGRGGAGIEGVPEKDPQWAGGYGLWVYNFRELPLQTGGNVYFHGALPYRSETDAARVVSRDPGVRFEAEAEGIVVTLDLGTDLAGVKTPLVTTALLGKAMVSGAAYESPDGTPLEVGLDFFGKKRNRSHPVPGPFEAAAKGKSEFRVK